MSILCLGQIVFDIIVQPIDDGIFERDTTRVKLIDFANGGDALNVAVVARKLGNTVGFCGKVGDDEKGTYLIQKMESYGLSTDGVIVTSKEPTSTAVALIRDKGARNFLFNGGATLTFTYEDIPTHVVKETDIVFVGGTFTMPLFDGEGARKLFKEAKEMGKITAMDVTYDSSGQWMKTIEPCLEYLDYFLPSEEQARDITGTEHVEEMAEILRSKHVKNVIIKMGSEGVYVKNETINRLFPPPYVDEVIDTTGAGDSFVAGFLSGINRGLDIEDSLELGQAVAARCIRGLGATAGVKDIEHTTLYVREEKGINMAINSKLQQMLADAEKRGYAVPSFNYSCIWDFQAILEAAEEERSPVILASHHSVFDMLSGEICAGIGKAAMDKATVPMVFHLDHSTEVDRCKKAIDLGYPSVMIDASALSLEENIKSVKEVVEYAKAKNVCVEAEIGRIKGNGYEGGHNGDDFLAQVDDAVALVEQSGVDTLAVGIGTAHGFYQGKPEINFQRLKEVNDVLDIPLVLHGGSGIPEEDIKEGILNGINKINVGTIIHCTLMNTFRSELMAKGENQYTLDIARVAMDEVKEVVRGWIRTCMSNGKAD